MFGLEEDKSTVCIICIGIISTLFNMKGSHVRSCHRLVQATIRRRSRGSIPGLSQSTSIHCNGPFTQSTVTAVRRAWLASALSWGFTSDPTLRWKDQWNASRFVS